MHGQRGAVYQGTRVVEESLEQHAVPGQQRRPVVAARCDMKLKYTTSNQRIAGH